MATFSKTPPKSKTVFRKTENPLSDSELRAKNEAAAKTISDYNSRISSGGYMSADDLAAYKNATNEYIGTGNAIAKRSNRFDTSAWQQVVQGLNDRYNTVYSEYSKYANQEDWDSSVAADKAAADAYQSSLNFDVAAGKQRLAELQSIASGSYDANKDVVMASAYDSSNLPYSEQQLRAMEYETMALEDKYGFTDSADLRSRIADLQKQIADAENIQARNALESSAFSMPDFASKSGYVSTIDSNENYNVKHELINHRSSGKDVITVGDDYNGFEDEDYNSRNWARELEYLTKMSEDEVKVYNYFINNNDTESAKKYLELLEKDLHGRRRASQAQILKEFADTAPLLASATSVLMAPAKGMAYLTQLAEYAVTGKVNENAAYNDAVNVSSDIRAARGEAISKAWDKALGENWGKVGEFGYQLGMSMGDFLLTAGVSGGNEAMALSLMGAGAAADTTIAAKRRGLDDGQALALGTVAGAAEVVSEKIGWDALFDSALRSKSKVTYLLKNVFSEGFEEPTSSVINTMADLIISGDKAELRAEAQKLIDKGIDPSKAWGQVFGEYALSLGVDAIGGMLSGAAMGGGSIGIGAISNYAQAQKEYRNLGQEVLDADGGVSGLQSIADAFKTDKKISKLLGKSDPKSVGKLYEAVSEKIEAQTAAELKEALEASGVSEEVSGKIASTLASVATGKQLSPEETTLAISYLQSKKISSAFDNVVLNPESAIGKQISSLAAVMHKKKTSATMTENTSPEPQEGFVEGAAEQTETGDFLKSSGEAVKSVQVAEIKDGNVTVTVNGKTSVPMDDVSWANEATALAYDIVTGTGDMTPDAANLILNNPKANTKVFLESAIRVFKSGVRNDVKVVENLDDNVIPSDEARALFNEGRKAAKASVDQAESTVYNAYLRAKGILQKTGKKASGTLRIAEDVDVDGFNDQQTFSAMTAAEIAPSLSVDIVLYEDDNPLKFGYYKYSEDAVYINVNARWSANSMMAYTLSHELVHRGKKGSPRKFKAFADFLVAEYGKAGEDVEALVQEQLAAAEAAGVTLTEDEAFEEVVCDAAQRMLTDTDAGKKLAAWGQQSKENANFLQKLKQWLTELFDNLRAYFKNAESDSKAANAFRKLDKNVQQILADLFVDMSTDAAEKISTIKAAGMLDKINTTGDGGVRYKHGNTEHNVKSSKNKKPSNSTASPLSRRPGNRGSIGSAHVNMSSTAAAELFGIDNINDLNDSVKMVISKLGELYLSVEKQIPVLDFKKTITGSNLEGSLLKVGVLQRGGTGASAYRYDNGHGLRVSNHSANADNFLGTGEHLSITLFERGKMNDFVSGEASVIEAVFRVRYLDNNPDALKALIHDIAHFIVYGEYHDTAGALRYNYSGTDDFKAQAEKRMEQDRIKRENASNKISTTDSDGNQLSAGQQTHFSKSQERDADGNLQVMYRGDSEEVTVYDRKKSKPSNLHGRGFYYTNAKSHAGQYGIVRAFYLNTVDPLMPGQHKITKDQMLRFLEAIENDGEDYDLYNYGEGATAQSVLKTIWGKGDFEMLQDISASAIGDLVAAVELFNEINGTTYDSIRLPTETVIFNSNQAKLTTNKNPTDNPDIRYKVSAGAMSATDSDGKQLSTGQQKYFANSVVRDDAGRLLVMYHGTSRGGFTVFDIYNSNHGLFGMGSYFTASKAIAEAYTNKGKGTTPQVYAVYLDIRNPLDMDAKANPAEWAEHFPDAAFPESGTNEDFYRAVEQYYEDEMYSRLEAADSIKETLQFGMGYDGITHMGGGRVDPNGESHRVYIAFTEEQIKSVDNLNPTTDIDINRKISSGAARRMLVDAFEEMIQSEDERKLVDTYRNYLNSTEDLEAPLMEVRSQIRQKVKEKAPKAEIDALRKKAETMQSALDANDSALLTLEAAKPLKDLMERASKKMLDERMESQRKELSSKYMESRHKAVEGRRATEVKNKIRRFKARLQASLQHGTESNYVVQNLVPAMIDLCELIDTDTDRYKKDGSVNMAQAKRDDTRDRLRKLRYMYDDLQKIKDDDVENETYKGEYDEDISKYLDNLERKFGDKSLNDMTLAELEEFYEILKSIDEVLHDARELIGEREKIAIHDVADRISNEQQNIMKKRKTSASNDWLQNMTLSPIRDVERMSGYAENSAMVMLMHDLEAGVRKKNFFIMESYKMFKDLTAKPEYEKAVYEPFGREYEDDHRRKFRVTKMQMMQSILSWEREIANKNLIHISYGGFTFANLDLLKKGNISDAISSKYAHHVPKAEWMVKEFIEALKHDAWCQSYMDASRKFFNGMAKNAINEASLAVKHRLIATGEAYIPLEVDETEVSREISAEYDVQKTINAYGMLKDIKQGASQPLIITGLNNIVDRHIEQVGTVYGLSVPVRNFNKVWNAHSEFDGAMHTVKAILETNWGKKGVGVIYQAVQDVQGNRISRQGEIYKKLKSNIIGSTFMLNLSVVTKQVASMYSANSELLKARDPASMIGNLLYTMANYKDIASEIDQHTASAWLRRQGLSDAELHTLMTEGKKSIVGKIADKLPAGINPAKWITGMDSAVAMSLWKYCKEDILADPKNKETMDRLSGKENLTDAEKKELDAVWRKIAEHYDNVIENTQSMSDSLHRPEIQKTDNVFAAPFSMFKTDTYQLAGQLITIAGRSKANPTKANKQALGRTVYAVASSAMWGQLMTVVFSLLRYKVDRYRDEEKELSAKGFAYRIGIDLLGDIMGYILPMFGGEAVDVVDAIITGDFSNLFDDIVFSDLNDLISSFISITRRLALGKEVTVQQWNSLSGLALSLFGVPAKNIFRIWEAIQKHAKDIADGEFLSFEQK